MSLSLFCSTMPDKYQHLCFGTDVQSVCCFIKIYLLDPLCEWASCLVLDLWLIVFLLSVCTFDTVCYLIK